MLNAGSSPPCARLIRNDGLELSTAEKVEQILWILLKLIGVFVVIFAFICSLALLTDAFKLIGGQGIGTSLL